MPVPNTAGATAENNGTVISQTIATGTVMSFDTSIGYDVYDYQAG
jgi:hypothetical protein